MGTFNLGGTFHKNLCEAYRVRLLERVRLFGTSTQKVFVPIYMRGQRSNKMHSGILWEQNEFLCSDVNFTEGQIWSKSAF